MSEHRRLHPARVLHNGTHGSHQWTQAWQIKSPQRHICSICGCRIPGTPSVQLRPTGREGKPQKWPYCEKCWNWVVLEIDDDLSTINLDPQPDESIDDEYLFDMELA